MKNKLADLNDHLFAQLERLSEEDLTPEQIEKEVARTDAIVDVSDQIIAGATLQFKAAKLVADHGEKIAQRLPDGFTNKPKTIEHRPPTSKTPDDHQREEVAARRAAREAAEEREEFKRQRKEAANADT